MTGCDHVDGVDDRVDSGPLLAVIFGQSATSPRRSHQPRPRRRPCTATSQPRCVGLMSPNAASRALDIKLHRRYCVPFGSYRDICQVSTRQAPPTDDRDRSRPLTRAHWLAGHGRHGLTAPAPPPPSAHRLPAPAVQFRPSTGTGTYFFLRRMRTNKIAKHINAAMSRPRVTGVLYQPEPDARTMITRFPESDLQPPPRGGQGNRSQRGGDWDVCPAGWRTLGLADCCA